VGNILHRVGELAIRSDDIGVVEVRVSNAAERRDHIHGLFDGNVLQIDRHLAGHIGAQRNVNVRLDRKGLQYLHDVGVDEVERD
jgi:hypothetical protein